MAQPWRSRRLVVRRLGAPWAAAFAAAFPPALVRAEPPKRLALDDRGTRVRWQGPPVWSAARLGSPWVQTAAQVDVRLDTRVVGHLVCRLYMRLMSEAPGVEVRWTPRYHLRAGVLVAGGEALVMQGVLPGGLLHEVLELAVRAPAELAQPARLRFAFEAEPVA